MRIGIITRPAIIIPIVLIVLACIAITVIGHYRDSGEEKVGVAVDTPHYGPLSFVVFGDPRIGHDSLINEFFYPEKLSSVVEEVNNIESPLVIVTGDMYWGDDDDEEDATERSEEFVSIMSDLNAEWYPVMGNHDAEGLSWAVTRDIIFGDQSTYYSFDQGDCHLIILDAYIPGNLASISEAQMSWLEYNIRTTSKPHIFVFLHPPLFPTGPNYNNSLKVEVRNKLVDIFTEYEVDIVFCGHEHYYSSFEYQGLMQVTTGGAGAQPLHDYKVYDDIVEELGYDAEQITRYKGVKAFHYVVVDINGSEVEIYAYDLDGLLIDNFSMTSKRALKCTSENDM